MVLSVIFSSCIKKEQQHPNIVLILVDDLGYGDLGSYNPESLIPTPNLDKLASEGIRLTNAYCPVSVCSPSRYALMTGSYPFRSWKKNGVMANYEPSMMSKNQLTLPQMLQNAGYSTAGFGKWHLGATFPTLDGEQPIGYGKFKAEKNGANVDVTKPISDGPVAHGFENWYGFSCASECWIMDKNNIVAALEHDFYNIEAAPNTDNIESIPSDKYLSLLTDKATSFMKDHHETRGNQPFFLYFAPYVPHIPLSVSEDFIGTTKAGLYGDYVLELDSQIGQLLTTLKELNQVENTLVLFASDNGSQFEITSRDIDLSKASNDPKDVIKKEMDDTNHYPNGNLRGTKWSVYEGGVRTPLIARWPQKIPANMQSDGLFALNDFMATISSLIDDKNPPETALDSYDQLALLMGKGSQKRESVLVQSSNNEFGLRMGKWKFINSSTHKKGEGMDQLYDLSEDISESRNLVFEKPLIAKKMKSELSRILTGQRTVIASED